MAGVGTNVARVLSFLGYQPDDECDCKSLAANLDRLGPEYCRQHFDRIVAALEIRAKEQNHVFSRTGARVLLKVAIAFADKHDKPRRQDVTEELKTQILG